MKVVAIGADISSNDVSVSDSLVENIEKDIPNKKGSFNKYHRR